MNKFWSGSLSLIFVFSLTCTSYAQYRNKPKYEKFDYKVYETPTFSIYNYMQDEKRLEEFAQWAEQWYEVHQETTGDSFATKNPIVLYNDHADFQQTNTVSGAIGIGTGGVTEAFKNRVIMPMAFTNQQSFHVLGHELVHAFQYRQILGGDSTSIQSFANLPLWMVEGMAEYMSIGRNDSHSAMWMRDVVLRDEIPSIKQLANPKYFPYRYGQALWSFLTSQYGDDIIEPLFKQTAIFGVDKAIQRVLGMSQEELSEKWKASLTDYYRPLMDGKSKKAIGRKILDEENAGKLNISPSLSPNGKYVIFISEKDIFSVDLFLADARNGKIIRKVASSSRGGHIDDFNYIESSGTWSPDGNQFAFVAVSKGANLLLIKNVEKGKTEREIRIEGLPAFTNPTWAPDGKSIVVSGMKEGSTDLYQYFLKTGRLKQLTDDSYAEIQANFSADGSKLIFASDRLSYPNHRTNGKWKLNISELDLESGDLIDYNIFPKGDNMNPQYDPEGNIYFLSDHDGFRNLYKYDKATAETLKMTDFAVGISGITKYAPAISVSQKKDRILYTHYDKGKYNIYKATSKQLLNQNIDSIAEDNLAGVLPGPQTANRDIVNANLEDLDNWDELAESEFETGVYRPKFKLDYVSQTGIGIGVSTNSTFGPSFGAAAGIALLFSDIVGNHQLFTGFSLNGDYKDFSGQAQYINNTGRYAWGVGLSHLPYKTGIQRFAQDPVFLPDRGIDAFVRETEILRIFEDQLSLFAQYPLSTTQRFEVSVAGAVRYVNAEILREFFEVNSLEFVGSTRTDLDVSSLDASGAFARGGLSYVSDNSFAGVTATPLKGHKLILGVNKYTGSFDFLSTTASFRKYHWVKPVSFAFRVEHFGRYGRDSGDSKNASGLTPIYIGNQFLIRGYDIDNVAELQRDNNQLDFERLIGSKYLLTNFEIRLPFTGPAALSAIRSNVFFSDLSLFFDGGLTYFSFDDFDKAPLIRTITEADGTVTIVEIPQTPAYVASVGVSLRINLFGALILEPFYAIPLQKKTHGTFGFNFWPGW